MTGPPGDLFKKIPCPLSVLIRICWGGFQVHNKQEFQFSREEGSETFREPLYGGRHITDGIYHVDSGVGRQKDEESKGSSSKSPDEWQIHS